MSSSLRKPINVPGICNQDCLKKLETLLSQSFAMQVDSSIPQNMKFKARLERTGLAREVHIEVFTNANVEIKSSPEIQTVFSAICDEMERILKEAVDMLRDQDTVRVNRANRILEFMRSIPTEPEVERMVVVTLCDIILDLLVTEKLSHFTRERQHLESESVGAKLAMLENQYRIPIYKPKAIRDIRDLRNKIAHGGASTAKEEAVFARDTTIEIFELL